MAFGNATKGYVRANSSGGGGGGTSDYSQLTNKPSINGVTLSGNKSSSDLHITSNVEVIEYTGNGVRQRIHDVGQHKAVQFLTDTPNGNVMSQVITRQTVTYWETFIANNNVEFGTGTVTHTDTTVSLQSQDVSREFNDNGGHYMIIVFR